VEDGPALGFRRSAPRDQIDSDDYPYLMRDYLSNLVGSVGYHIGTGPEYIYIYTHRLRTPNTFQPNQSTLFNFPALGVYVT
jgi:hypothetical protein